MKYLGFLVIVAVAQGFVLDTRASNNIPVPIFSRLTVVDPPGFEVEWTSVQNLGNPILGYRVKVWELVGLVYYKLEEVDGEMVWVEYYQPPNIQDKHPKKEEIREIDNQGPANTKVLISGLKPGSIYEVKVSAYTRNAEGAESEHLRVQLQGDEKDDNNV